MNRDEQIADVAARQHGVITRSQLFDLGVSTAAIGRRTKSGRLRPLHRGVYRVGPLERERTPEMAAALAGGSGAVLSHTSALHLWSLLGTDPPRPIHVIVPRSRSPRSGVIFHRCALADDECTVIDGIRLTTPIRTIVDVAGILGSREVERALAAAEREGLIGSAELAGLLDRYPRRPGMAILRELIGENTGPQFTRSEAERRCLDLLGAARLPRPHTNVPVGPYEIDLLWPEEGVGIEIDGRRYHSSRARFEGDRRKDNWLRARGIEIIRLTWRQLTREATATAVLVGQALALARARRRETAAPAGHAPPPWPGPSPRPETDLATDGPT